MVRFMSLEAKFVLAGDYQSEGRWEDRVLEFLPEDLEKGTVGLGLEAGCRPGFTVMMQM